MPMTDAAPEASLAAMGESCPDAKRSARALAEATGRLAAIVESSDDAIMATVGSVITTWNAGAATPRGRWSGRR
jgi:PAS domain-containing protein